MSLDIDALVSVAESATGAGAREALSSFRSGIKSENKRGESTEALTPSDVVTAADRTAQKTVVDVVQSEYPDHQIVGEEGNERKTVPEDGIAWVIDPIDGTYNFVRGLRYWATSVAVVRDEKPIAAVTILPALEDRYVADTERVTRNGADIAVSDRATPEAFTVSPGVIPTYGERRDFAIGTRDIVERFGNMRRFGTPQVDLALLADGSIEGVVTAQTVNPWDSIAGVHLVRQAGGTVTDIDGDPWAHGATGLVASNGADHESILEVGQTMAGSS